MISVAIQADPVRGSRSVRGRGVERSGDGPGQVLEPVGQFQVSAEPGLVEPFVDGADLAAQVRAEHRQPRGRLRLGAYHVNLAAAAVLIGVVSVTLSLVGLELGNRLGNKTGERGELIGGLVLIAVGIAIAGGIL